MKQKFLNTTFLISTFLVLQPLTPLYSATNSAEFTDEVKNNVRDRIQKVLSVKDQKNNVFLGEIESVSTNSLTVRADGISHLVDISTNTLITQEGNAIELVDTPMGANSAVIGTLDQNEMILAEKILILNQAPQKTTKTPQLAQVINIAPNRRSLTLSSPSLDNPITVSITRNSRFHETLDQSDSINLSEIQLEDELLIIYQPQTSNPDTLDLILAIKLTDLSTDEPTSSLDTDQ